MFSSCYYFFLNRNYGLPLMAHNHKTYHRLCMTNLCLGSDGTNLATIESIIEGE